jgi:hypothetical protein
MVDEFYQWFGDFTTNVVINVPAPADGSTFVSQTVNGVLNPATITLNAGQTYPMSVVMRNSGTSVWFGDYYYGIGSANPLGSTVWTTTRARLPLLSSAPIGTDWTFSFNITTPTTPGTYNLQWRTLHDANNNYYTPNIPANWFGASTNNIVVTVPAPADGSTFVSQTVNGVTDPATITLNAGQTYPMTVTMTNSGTSIWSGAYYYGIGSANPLGTTTWTTTRSRLVLSPAETVAIGANKTFSFNITAPTTPGTYNLQWRTVHDGDNTFYTPSIAANWFGATTNNVVVTVAQLPVVTTPTSASITQTGATLGANVTSLGVPASITARGTCWGTTPAPTTNCIPASGLTTGVFTHARTGLTASTMYYYRGYATNSTGTGYSADGTFTTSAANAVPTVTSPTASGITSSGATLGANVTSLGIPASISERGTCWGTSPAPTTNCTAASGLTTGVFTHARTSMPTNTTIYYRGYATNTTGTGYSADGTFSTSAGTFTLSISSNPSPTGHVSSSVGGISCGTISGVSYTSCVSSPITSGTTVVLTPTPASSYWRFSGWSGDCTGSGACSVVVNSNKSVTANFVIRSFNYNEF